MRYREPRYPADKDLCVILGDEVRPAQLVNVSITGARLGQLGSVARNTLLTVSYLQYRFSAQVMWTDSEFTGVRFLVPLSTSELNALRREGSRASSGWGSAGIISHVFRETS